DGHRLVQHAVNDPGHQVSQRRAGATILDQFAFRPGQMQEHALGKMRGRARPAGPEIQPGADFMRVSMSGRALMPLLLLTASTIGTVATVLTVARSRTGSTPASGFSRGMMAIDKLLNIRV